MSKTLVIKFKTNQDKNYHFTIAKPNENLELSTVRTAVDKIIETKAFDNSKRELKSFEKAVYVIREEIEIV